ncbi:hypothetical protein ACOMHN_031610 [Nucella lapillus]
MVPSSSSSLAVRSPYPIEMTPDFYSSQINIVCIQMVSNITRQVVLKVFAQIIVDIIDWGTSTELSFLFAITTSSRSGNTTSSRIANTTSSRSANTTRTRSARCDIACRMSPFCLPFPCCLLLPPLLLMLTITCLFLHLLEKSGPPVVG